MGELSELSFYIESLSCLTEFLGEHYQYKQEYEFQKNVAIFKISTYYILQFLNNNINEINKLILETS